MYALYSVERAYEKKPITECKMIARWILKLWSKAKRKTDNQRRTQNLVLLMWAFRTVIILPLELVLMEMSMDDEASGCFQQ